MSIFKDTRQLASKLVEMVTAIVEGKEKYRSMIQRVMTMVKELFRLTFVHRYLQTRITTKEVLIDSGYYSEKDVK